MDPSRQRYYKSVFLIAAIYDIVLGVAFTFFHIPVFDMIEVTPPESGYVQLLGAFFIVIGLAYYLIWRGDLQTNRDMILVGTLYKLAYSAIAFAFWVMGDLPHVLFAALFGVADLVFFVLMLECWLYLGRSRMDAARA